MKFPRYTVFALVLSGMPFLCGAQNPPAQNPPPQSPNDAEGNVERATPAAAMTGLIGMDSEPVEDDSSQPPQVPPVLGGREASLAFTSELERSNYLRAGLNVGVAYDDNALIAPIDPIGNVTYSVFPNIEIDQSFSQVRWTLKYDAGVTINQRLSNQNQGAHNLDFESLFRLSPHVSLRVAEVFSLSSGIFAGGDNTSIPSSSIGPNTSILTPLASQRWSSTIGEMNYHFALNDVIGGSGTFYDLHYGDAAPTSSSLVDSRTASASGFWLHRLEGRDWSGVCYRFQRLTYDPNGETRVQSFAVVNTISIPKRFTLTAFIGPEYSDNHGTVTTGAGAGQTQHTSDWGITGGIEGAVTSARTSLALGYAKRANDGGGLLGAVHSHNVHADFRRELFPGWSAIIGARYGNNNVIGSPVAGNPSSINTTTLGGTIERSVGKSFGLSASYYHDLQSQSGAANAAQNFDAHKNRFLVTLSYQWAKALGR